MAVRSKSGGRSGGGFTLLELMIAVGVILVAVLGTFGAQFTSHQLVRTARETETASLDLQAAMEQVMMVSPDLLPIPGGRFPAGQPIAAFTNRHLRNELLVATYPNYPGGATVPDPLDVVLTLTWQDFRDRPRTMQLACRKTR